MAAADPPHRGRRHHSGGAGVSGPDATEAWDTHRATAGDGTPVPLRILAGRGGSAATAVVWPAMGVPARHYRRLGEQLHAGGHRVVIGELRGVGDSPVRASRTVDFGYRDLVEGEVATSVGFARRSWPDAPVALVGHSLGGQLALLYTAGHPGAVDAVALTAASSIDWRAYGGAARLGVLAFTQCAAAVATLLGHFPGHRLGFGGREPRMLIRDWARAARSGRWDLAGDALDRDAALGRVQLPVLSLTLAGDRLAPRSAADALVAPLARADVTRRHLSAAHLGGTTDHVGWLRAPERVVDAVTAWLAATLRPSARPAGNAAAGT